MALKKPPPLVPHSLMISCDATGPCAMTCSVTVVVVSLLYILLSSLAMGVADLLGFWRPRGGSVRGTVASSVLPAIALVVIAV